jgi:hypothetical protein
MQQPEGQPRLIHTKRGAVFALCLTGYVAASTIRDLLSHPHRRHLWPVNLDGLALWHVTVPSWIVVGTNLLFYTWLIWAGIMVCRPVKGSERLLVLGWITSTFLGLTQIVVSPFVASAVQYAKAAITAVAFIAALDILLRMPAGGYPRLR